MGYVIRRVSPLNALFYGLLLGLAGWLLPGALLGWLARAAVLNLRDWLGGLQLTIPLPLGESINFDLAAALSLTDTHTRLTALAGQDAALMIAVALGTAAAGMLLTGLTAFLAALLYNLFAGLFGGVEVTVDALDAPIRRAAPQEPPRKAGTQSRPPAGVATAAPPPRVAARPQAEPARPARPAPVAWLSSASNSHERWALRADVTRIGSSPENDIILPGLATQHADIRRESDRYLIYDLGSRRTWVNDAQVAAVHMLKDGSRLQLGQSEFVVHIPTTNAINEETR